MDVTLNELGKASVREEIRAASSMIQTNKKNNQEENPLLLSKREKTLRRRRKRRYESERTQKYQSVRNVKQVHMHSLPEGVMSNVIHMRLLIPTRMPTAKPKVDAHGGEEGERRGERGMCEFKLTGKACEEKMSKEQWS